MVTVDTVDAVSDVFEIGAMHPRESFFPSRRETTAFGSCSAKQSESVRRQSSVSQLGRRTTAVGSFGATKTDPRPLRNGDYLRSCATKVEDFVKAAPPKEPLSPKAFASPTARDFAVIWETLLNALDPKWCKRLKGKKLEDQVPSVLKGLGYTLTISKSALSAPGSTHSWPQILLALEWLVDTIQLRHKYDRDQPAATEAMETDDADDVLGMDLGTILDWMTESYEKYMAFDDTAVKEIDQSFFSGIQLKQEQQQQGNAQRQKEVEAVDEELKKLQQTVSPLVRIRTELEAMQQDEAALTAKLKQIEELTVKLKKKCAELESEIQNKFDQTKALTTEVEVLRERVSKQSVDKEDIARLLSEKQKLEQLLQNAQSHKATVESELNQREVQRDGLLNQLEKYVHSYNNHSRQLKLIPVGSKHSMGVDFSIAIDRNVSELQALCTADHKGVLQPGLVQVKEHYQKKKEQLMSEVHQLEQNESQLQQEIQKLHHQRQSCVQEIQKVEQETGKYKQATSAATQQALEQCHSLQEEIEKLQMQRQEMIQSIEQQLPEAESLYQQTASHCQKQSQEMAALLKKVVQQLRAARSAKEAALDQMNQQTEEATHLIENMMQE